jgi:hypothetical protein
MLQCNYYYYYYCHHHRHCPLRFTQAMCTGVSSGLNRSEREANHSPPPVARDTDAWSFNHLKHSGNYENDDLFSK